MSDFGLEELSPPQKTFRNWRSWGIGLGVLGAVVTLGGLTLLRRQSPPLMAAASPLTVETLTVTAVAGYDVARAYTGEIAPVRSSDLGFVRGGELVRVLVREGDTVALGQGLVLLDNRNLQAQRQQLEAQRAEAQARLLELRTGARPEDIAAARAQVRDVQNQLGLSEQQRSRRDYLYSEGVISREQLEEVAFGTDALRARLDQAQSRLEQLLNGTRREQITAQEATVRQIEARIAQVDVELAQSTLRAPYSGIVSTQQAFEGVVVGASQPVLRLVENEPPEARIGLPPAVAERLQVGNQVSVVVQSESYAATVKSRLPEVDANTRTQPVVFQLDRAAVGRVAPGQTVRVELTETLPVNGFWVPTQALTQDLRGLWRVYAVLPTEANIHTVQPKVVEILHLEETRVLVQGTLQAGDRIVASGTHRLIPGQPVHLEGSL